MHRSSPLPGFGIGLGVLIGALTLVVLLPLGALIGRGVAMGPAELAGHLGSARVANALLLSFRAALIASAFNLVFGLLLAWVLTRYSFPGRRLIDAAVDLPFALPTAVSLAWKPCSVGHTKNVASSRRESSFRLRKRPALSWTLANTFWNRRASRPQSGCRPVSSSARFPSTYHRFNSASPILPTQFARP